MKPTILLVILALLFCSSVVFAQHPPSSDEVKIFPNPATTFIKVEIEKNNQEITINNMIGTTVLHQPLEKGENSIDISGLKPGIYMVQVGTRTIRILKE